MFLKNGWKLHMYNVHNVEGESDLREYVLWVAL